MQSLNWRRCLGGYFSNLIYLALLWVFVGVHAEGLANPGVAGQIAYGRAIGY